MNAAPTKPVKTGAGVAQRVISYVGRMSPSIAAAAMGAGLTAVVAGTPLPAQAQDISTSYESPLTLQAGTELMTSEGSSFNSFGADALRTDFALALTHRSDSGLITRFEAGGTQRLASPLDPEVSPQGSHYVVMSLAPEDGKFDFGVVARGRQLGNEFIPMDSLGVAFRMSPTKNSSLGLSVDSVFPDGDVHKIGDNLQIMGNFSIKF